jgi:alpha-amylase
MSNDLPLRAPMSWTPSNVGEGGFTAGATPFRPTAPNVAMHNAQTQRADPNSVLHFYKQMIALRNARPSIARGTFEHSFADGLVLGYQRRLGKELTLVLINYGREAAQVRVRGVSARTRLTALHPVPNAEQRGATLTAPPRSVQVFDLR